MSFHILDTAGEFSDVEYMDAKLANDLPSAMPKAQTALRSRQPTSIEAAHCKKTFRADCRAILKVPGIL
jgi:hypothetical protein